MNALKDSSNQQWTECVTLLNKFTVNATLLNIEDVRLKQQEYRKVYDVIYKFCGDPSFNNFGECKIGRGEKIYKSFASFMETFLKELNKDAQNTQGIFKIKKLNEVWEQYRKYMNYMKKLFSFVDRSYVMEEHKDQIQTVGIQKFKELILQNRLQETQNIFLMEVNLMRTSKNYSSSSSLCGFMKILLNLGGKYRFFVEFIDALKSKYLTNTKQHYLKCYGTMTRLSYLDYFNTVEDLLSFQLRMAVSCLTQTACPKKQIQALFIEIFIEGKKQTLLEDPNGWMSMLRDERAEELRKVTEVYNKYSNIDGLKFQYQRYISEEWIRFMKNTTAEAERFSSHGQNFAKMYVIRKIFEFDKQNHDMITRHLHSLPSIVSIYRMIVQRVLSCYSQSQYKASHLLSTYWNRIATSDPGDHQLNQSIKNIFRIFQCLHDCNTYIKIHEQQLIQRMLDGSVKINDQRKFMQELVLKRGSSDAHNIVGLFDGYDESTNNQKALTEQLNKYKLKTVKVSLMAFSIDVWPFKTLLPEASHQYKFLTVHQAAVQSLIKGMHPKSKVIFDRLLGKTTLTMKKDSDPNQLCEIIVNDLQAALIMLIGNSKIQMTMKEIMQKYGKFGEQVIKQQLHPLMHSKRKILIQEGDVYRIFYEGSQSTLNYFTFPNTKKDIEILASQDLTLRIQSYIVRRLKLHKRMEYSELIEDITQAMASFRPDPMFIRKCIEEVNNKNYIHKSNDIVKYVDS